MAYASIAGLPVQVGLYVALVPMLVYALLGSSRPLSVSSTATLAILTSTELTIALPGADPAHLMAAAATLAMLVGAFLMVAGVLRLGFLANFISDPVLTGFKAGIGLVVVLDQLPKLLGVHGDRGTFIHQVFSTFRQLPETNHATLILGATTAAIVLAIEHFRPRAPAPLVAVIVGVAAAGLFGLESIGVTLTGPIPSGIPRPVLPDLLLVKILWPGALGMALMSFTESIAAGRAFA
jgi:MFS superfamily sulfate permease-like transporter